MARIHPEGPETLFEVTVPFLGLNCRGRLERRLQSQRAIKAVGPTQTSAKASELTARLTNPTISPPVSDASPGSISARGRTSVSVERFGFRAHSQVYNVRV